MLFKTFRAPSKFASDTWKKDYVQNSNCVFLKMSSENKSFIVEINQNSRSNNADPTLYIPNVNLTKKKIWKTE